VTKRLKSRRGCRVSINVHNQGARSTRFDYPDRDNDPTIRVDSGPQHHTGSVKSHTSHDKNDTDD
jgi:hypothetical protein